MLTILISRPPIYKVYLQSEFTLLFGELPNNLHDVYENEMGKKADMLTLLKLICLESLTQSGIKSKIYDSIKKDFLEWLFSPFSLKYHCICQKKTL